MFRPQVLVSELSPHHLYRRLSQAILLATLLLLLTAAPSTEAQGRRCWIYNSSITFWLPDSGFLSGDIPLFLNRNCSAPAEGVWNVGEYGAATALNEESAISKCNRYNGHSNNTVRRGGSYWYCRPVSGSSRGSSGGSSGGSGGSSGGGGRSANQPKPSFDGKRPLAGVVVGAEMGTNSGIVFQRMTHHAVGIQSVIDRGVLDVVDVWGNANQYFDVCFPQAGRVLFLDAATAPRTVLEPSNFTRDGYSCAAMSRAGTMVLVKGPTVSTESTESTKSSASVALAQQFIDSTTDPVSSAIDLRNCEVTPEHNLRLRAAPWGEQLDIVPSEITLTASARTQSWFKVTYEETEGWIAAWLSDSEGDCDWEDAGDDSPALASSDNQPTDPVLSVT